MTTTPPPPRLFALVRDTGLSGTAHVADGVVWPDGTVTVRWRGDEPSTVQWASLDDAGPDRTAGLYRERAHLVAHLAAA